LISGCDQRHATVKSGGAGWPQITVGRLENNRVKTKIIRNTSAVETSLDYNDWRNPRSMSVAERERLIREYEKRTNIRIL
jgi:hypothetical protein